MTPLDLDRPEVRSKLDDYEVIDRPDGSMALRLRPYHRTKILIELMQYVAPKLRVTEVKGSIDRTVTVVLQKVGIDGKLTEVPISQHLLEGG